MNYGRNDDKLQRVRNILTAMDRSIDAARAKRQNPGGPRPIMAPQAITNTGAERVEAGEPRLPTSIFDRSGPRIKARPKQQNGQ